MKRVMMLVLPTDWSPRNTSLYFARAEIGAIVEISDTGNQSVTKQDGEFAEPNADSDCFIWSFFQLGRMARFANSNGLLRSYLTVCVCFF